MPELHLLPNVEYLHTIEDEIYEYAVNHPEEYISEDMEEGSVDFVYKMGMLYRFGEHNKTACEARDKIRRGENNQPHVNIGKSLFRSILNGRNCIITDVIYYQFFLYIL